MTRTPSPTTRATAALFAALLALLVAPAAAQQTTIEFRVSEQLALHWWVRAEAERPASIQQPEALAAVAALGSLQQEVETPTLAWMRVDAFLLSGLTMPSAVARAFGMPGRYSDLSDDRSRLHDLKPDPQPYTDALKELAPWYRANISPRADANVQATITNLKDYLPSKLPDCYRDACEALGMADPGLTVPVYLVPTGPRPGAITYHTKDGPVCVVALDAGADCQGAGLDLLIEVIFHETLHALDVATQDQPTALNQLRTALRESDHAARLRDVPHTLIFLQAAAIVRDHFGPDHRGYGDLCRYYRKVPEAIAALREPWAARLDAKVPLPETIAQVIALLDEAARVENDGVSTSQPAAE